MRSDLKHILRIEKFWETSKNAVRIQIYCAMITYCLVAIVQHDMRLERCIYEVVQVHGILLTTKNNLRDLFNKSSFKNITDSVIQVNRIYFIGHQYKKLL